MSRLIGLCGYGGVGKSEVAKILRGRHGFEGPHIKTPIANMVRALLRDFDVSADLIERYIDGDLKREVVPEIGVTSTFLQQTVGFGWGRALIRQDLWLNLWLKRVGAILDAGGGVVQESVRAPDEVDAIRSHGGMIVLIERPGVGPLPGHPESEFVPRVPDRVLVNDGTLSDLMVRVADLVSSMAPP